MNSDQDIGQRSEAEVLSKIIDALADLSQPSRLRILSTVSTFFSVEPAPQVVTMPPSAPRQAFSEHSSISVKDFMWQKQPKTAVERIAALAFYLTHFRDTPFFKTAEI